MLRKTLIVWLVVFLAPGALAQTPGTVYRELNTGLAFPANLGPLKYVGVMDYAEKGRPDLGISVRYALPGSTLRADIYLYNLNRENLGTGLESPEVAKIFQQSLGDIFTLEKRGNYQDVRKLSEGRSALQTSRGKLPLLHARLSYSQPPGPGVSYTGPQVSNLYVTAYKNYFLKIRFSYPDNGRRAEYDQALEQFLADLGKLL